MDAETDLWDTIVWRPISTAPDTEQFLAYDEMTETYDICWMPKGRVEAVQFDQLDGPGPGEFGFDPKGITLWAKLPWRPGKL